MNIGTIAVLLGSAGAFAALYWAIPRIERRAAERRRRRFAARQLRRAEARRAASFDAHVADALDLTGGVRNG